MPVVAVEPQSVEEKAQAGGAFFVGQDFRVGDRGPFRRQPPRPPPADPFEALLREANACRACPLADCATQVVFGEGPSSARTVIVGEQPGGDREDLEGRPFVGPAGKLLRAALRDAGFAENEVYLINAVKHFKFEPRGKRRIHKTPRAGDIDRCRFWLDRELELATAPLIVTLGASGLRAVPGAAAMLKEPRGRTIEVGGHTLLPTIYLAYLLRLPDREAQRGGNEGFRGRPGVGRVSGAAYGRPGSFPLRNIGRGVRPNLAAIHENPGSPT